MMKNYDSRFKQNFFHYCLESDLQRPMHFKLWNTQNRSLIVYILNHTFSTIFHFVNTPESDHYISPLMSWKVRASKAMVLATVLWFQDTQQSVQDVQPSGPSRHIRGPPCEVRLSSSFLVPTALWLCVCSNFLHRGANWRKDLWQFDHIYI